MLKDRCKNSENAKNHLKSLSISTAKFHKIVDEYVSIFNIYLKLISTLINKGGRMISISHIKLQFTTHNLTTGHQDITTTTFHGQLH